MHVTYSYRCSSFLRFVKIIEIILPCSSFSICSFFFFDFKRKIGRPKEDAGDIGIVHIAIDGNFSRFYRWYFIATMSAFRRGNLTTNKKHGRIRASLRFDPSRDPRVLFDSTLRRFQSIPKAENSCVRKETAVRLTDFLPGISSVRSMHVRVPFKYLPTKQALCPWLKMKIANRDGRKYDQDR